MTIPGHIIDFWERRYLDDDIPWDRGDVSPALEHWLGNGAVPPCRILIPGCGRGHEVVELARRGFEVVGVDVAPAAVAELQQRLRDLGAEADVVCADLLNWIPEQKFDAIYEQTCLCAIAPEVWPRYSRRLRDWLHPGGYLFALFMQTDSPGGPPYHCEIGAMRALFADDCWDWPAGAPLEVAHPSGIRELGYALRRRSE